jgi:hypothetical protein
MRTVKTLLAIVGVVSLVLLAYYGSEVGRARYREYRAHQEEIRSDDEDLREWASQPTDDPLVAKLHDCLARLTYTKDGGYAEMAGTAAKECWEARAKAAKEKFDAEVAAFGGKLGTLSADDKARLYDECFAEANVDISMCYKIVYGPQVN